MKRIIILVVFASVACHSVLAQENGQEVGKQEGVLPAEKVLTLEECQEMARDNYPQIKQFQLIEASEKYDLAIASASWIPQFSISGKATWQSDVVEMPFEMPGFDFDMHHDQYSLTGNVTQHIWDGGVSQSKKAAVKTGAEVQRKQLEVSLYSVRSRVQNIYLGILLIDAQLEQNRLLMESLKRNADNVKSLIENGMAYKSDADIVKVNMLDCTQQADVLKADRLAYVRMLGMLTGMDMTDVDFVMPSDAWIIDRNNVYRPELALYSAQQKQNEAKIKQLNAQICPQFDLTLQGGYGRPGLNMLKNEFAPMFIAGIRMQWNIGAFYTRKNDKRKIENSRQEIELQQNLFLFNTSLDVTQKETEVEKARMMLEKDEDIIALRSSVREAGEEQYRNGIINMTDLMNMIDNEHNARLAKSIHHIQLLMAVYDMKNTLGQ